MQKQGSILLDSGAQISLIRNETAASLGLKGRDTSITITEVGGDEETITTKVYKVPVCTPDRGNTYSVKAIGITHISDDVTPLQIKPMAKQLGIENEKIRRAKGPVDLLIGIDHAQLHTEQRNVRVGDVAVLSDDNKAIRGKWTICIVIEVYPGPDGRVRNVKVKTAESEYLRPVTKIAIICPAEGYDC